MNAIVQPLPRVSLARIYALEGKHEFLRLLRAPMARLWRDQGKAG